MYKSYIEIIELLKDQVTPEVLRSVMILLEQFDTEAKQNILTYQRGGHSAYKRINK